MSQKESIEERKFVKLLFRTCRIRAIKYTDSYRRGGPDRQVLLPGGKVVFIEFKRQGEGLRPEQEAYHDYLRSLEHEVHLCVFAKEALSIIKKHLGDFWVI